jgi:hypothetical protein
MMTFEEFFAKKKIHLESLNETEPRVVEELRAHYEQMGEKSFDQRYKFLFNEWRLRYPIRPSVV